MDYNEEVYKLTVGDIQLVANDVLGRPLDSNEVELIKSKLEFNWYDTIETLIELLINE